MPEELERIFGSGVRVKLLKLFLFNPNSSYSGAEVADRSKSTINSVRREMGNLEKSGLIRKSKILKKGSSTWSLNQKFLYIKALNDFFSSSELLGNKQIVSKISKVGKVQLLLISGIFIKNPESRVDIFIVGDNFKKGALSKVIGIIESEMGREIRYAFFTTNDFKYRFAMFDKLIRDVLDYPHEKVVNKLNI